MELKVENEDTLAASFLDLALAVNVGVIDTKPFVHIGKEVLKICRATSYYDFFFYLHVI